MNSITNKLQFYKLWKNLELGNRIQIFDTLDEFLSSSFEGKTSIRYKQAGSAFKAFHIPPGEVIPKLAEFLALGAKKELFTFNESTPDDCLLIQGEIQRSPGLNLTYNTKKCSMKEAMECPTNVSGLKAKMILEYYMNPKSYDMLNELMDIYPDDVVEFGVYGKNLGIIPGHNTVIWEVRGY